MTRAEDTAHPRSEDVAAYVERVLPEPERLRMEAHLAACERCRTEIAELKLFFRRERARRSAWVALPIGAVAAAMLVLAVWPSAVGDGPHRFRDGVETGSGMPVIEVIAPTPRGVLAGDRVEFTWQALGDDIFYRVTVAAESGELIWHGESHDTTLAVPPGIEFASGGTYHWFVDALLPDGREATSGVRQFQVEP